MNPRGLRFAMLLVCALLAVAVSGSLLAHQMISYGWPGAITWLAWTLIGWYAFDLVAWLLKRDKR